MLTVYRRQRPPRFAIERDFDGERIVIRQWRRSPLLLLLPAWLVLTAIDAFDGLSRVFQTARIEPGFWMAVWGLAGISAALVFAWIATGRELIRVRGGNL